MTTEEQRAAAERHNDEIRRQEARAAELRRRAEMSPADVEAEAERRRLARPRGLSPLQLMSILGMSIATGGAPLSRADLEALRIRRETR